MATTTITNRAREDWLKANIDIETDTNNMALYNGSGHAANTSAYTATNESSGTGYVAKGKALTGVVITIDTSNNVAFVDWDDVVWTSSSITSTDCLIFADSVTTPVADPSIYVGDFGGSKTSSSGNFTVQMPVTAWNTAIVRIA